jgi:TPR repeat protein
VICPKCGEDNSDNFRFCGMCGTLLEARLEARRPAGAPVPGLPKIANASEPLRPLVVDAATHAANKPVPSISGPSVLGLDRTGTSQPGINQRSPNQPGPNQPSPNQPTIDSLREKSFSGLDSFFEPEQPKTGSRRIFLLVALLAALGAAGWWTYTNYLGATESRKPEAATSSAGSAAEKPSTKPAGQAAAPPLDAGSSQAVAPPAGVPGDQAGNASAGPGSTGKTAEAEAKPATEAKPVTPAPAVPRIAVGDKSAEKSESRVTAAKAPKLPAPAAADTGDAAFHKGEAYLYGRGAPANCNEAVKYLKAASAKSNAKARSTFGTMYATGHCVPRDLPTSYLWFALALRADPNNQILEKDLSAVWNQMTPPERQLATRMKQ